MKDFAKGPYNRKKALLQYVTPRPKDKKNSRGTRVWDCHVCLDDFRGSYTRVKSHFLGVAYHGVKSCPNLIDEQILECQRLHLEAEMEGQNLIVTSPSIPSQSSRHISSAIGTSGSPYESRGKRKMRSDEKGLVESMFNAQAKEKCDASIGRFFVANGIPYHATRSTYYKQMVKDILSINSSFVPPGEHKLRTIILHEEYSKVVLLFEDMKGTWVRTGCSIVMDGWTDVRHWPLINIIVTSPAGSYFLEVTDCLGKKKDAKFKFTILRDAIEEIRLSSVVQV